MTYHRFVKPILNLKSPKFGSTDLTAWVILGDIFEINIDSEELFNAEVDQILI